MLDIDSKVNRTKLAEGKGIIAKRKGIIAKISELKDHMSKDVLEYVLMLSSKILRVNLNVVGTFQKTEKRLEICATLSLNVVKRMGRVLGSLHHGFRVSASSRIHIYFLTYSKDGMYLLESSLRFKCALLTLIQISTYSSPKRSIAIHSLHKRWKCSNSQKFHPSCVRCFS